MTNTLYYGDNLDVLRRHVQDETIDLIYLDPPFKSNQDYNVLFREQDGSRSAAQIRAFEDTWQWDQAAAAAFQEVVEEGGQPSLTMQAFRTVLGDSDMLAYLSMMAPRLKELRRVLKPAGSIYLHCDPTASHYLKMLMDGIFGPDRFVNELIWVRANAHNLKTRFWPRQHDTLLLYGKSPVPKLQPVYQPYGPKQLKRYKPDENGRLCTGQDLTVSLVRRLRQFEWRGTKPPAHRSWGASREQLEEWYAQGRILLKQDGTPRLDGLKVYLDETKGKQVGTVWDDIPRIRNTAAERLGYPTQKPEGLLERIITASTDCGDTVLDPFCGCGTAIAVAQKLNRRWIGIDVTHLAVTLMKHRLKTAFGEVEYRVLGEPTTVADAQILAAEDPYQFQWWALGLVNARPVEQKKGADKGIDGRIFFHDEHETAKTKQIVLSVKAGKTGPAHVRDLRGVIDREKAAMGVLITMEAPTAPMRKEAASAGFYECVAWKTKHPRIQILTVGELLEGKTLDAPATGDIRTFKKAPRARAKSKESQRKMFD